MRSIEGRAPRSLLLSTSFPRRGGAMLRMDGGNPVMSQQTFRSLLLVRLVRARKWGGHGPNRSACRTVF